MDAAREELEREDYLRLTQPRHETVHRFAEHERVEGFFETRGVPDFFPSDRLMKLESEHGSVQLGYDPKKARAFLFARVKTSVLGTAPSRYQGQMNDRDRRRARKSGNENVAFTARRGENSSVLLYKMENKPWTPDSVAPYVMRQNMEALRRTMPFLTWRDDAARRAQVREQARETPSLTLSRRLDALNSLIWRKQRESQNFFRRVNGVFDQQKNELFLYYRAQRERRTLETENAPPAPPEEDEKQ